MSIVETMKAAKPFFAVVFLQFGLAGMDILCKAALNRGMSNYVLVVYRHAVATAVVAPFAVILDKVFVFLEQKSETEDDAFDLHQDNAARFAGASSGPKSVLSGNEVHNSNVCSSYVQYSSRPYFCNGLGS
ncbi:hypothetical protein C1H46_043761 [Malus baccata]|uniref:WAT1-related protein n=1 Tax=Malus baccata TaxID=106549 RepID=A0A540K8Z9_MALBA|nr:hypothetical protein C1H46_043761 [Malus baccata]